MQIAIVILMMTGVILVSFSLGALFNHVYAKFPKYKKQEVDYDAIINNLVSKIDALENHVASMSTEQLEQFAEADQKAAQSFLDSIASLNAFMTGTEEVEHDAERQEIE